MTLTRDTILSTLREHLEADPRILALWLEGADTTGSVDEYSDLDVCCSVETGALEPVTTCAREALESLGRLDLVDASTREDDFWFTIYHLEGTSPYLLIDFNAFVSRGCQFFSGDAIEKPLVLFDRAGMVRFIQPQVHLDTLIQGGRLRALVEIAGQGSRIEKYIRRGDFLEAFGYYHKWLLQPLIEVLRMRYTPLHPDYYIVHISHHLPSSILAQLENFFQIGSLAELAAKSKLAKALFDETTAYLAQEYEQARAATAALDRGETSRT